MPKIWPGATIACLLVSTAWGQGIVDEYVSANELAVTVDFGGVITADIAVSFEDASGLTPGALGVSVDQVDPTDTTLISRLPSGGLVSIPAAFPVKLSIAPPTNSDLMFRGAAIVSFYTHNLSYVPGTPLRLFKASHGGAFYDVTDRMSSGSYRVRGTQGEFSEFMIVADLRPAGAVVLEKFDRLDALLAAHENDIAPALHASLTARAAAARSAYSASSLIDAIENLAAFATQIRKSGGGEIPDAWRPRGDLDNVAGQLRGAAATLGFSLSLLVNGL